MLRVKSRQDGDVTAHTHAHQEKFIGAAVHCSDLSLYDLLHVLVTFRLQDVLTGQIPSAASAFVVFFEHNWSLDADDIDELVYAEKPIRGLAEEIIDIGLWVLTVIVKEDHGGDSWVDQRAIRGTHRLVDDVISNVMLHQAVLSDWLF